MLGGRGMTWEDFINSTYNFLNLTYNNDPQGSSPGWGNTTYTAESKWTYMVVDENQSMIRRTDIIMSGYNYTLVESGFDL